MQKYLARIFTVFVDIVLVFTLSAGTVKSAQAQTLAPDPVDTIIIRGQVIDAPAGARVQAAHLDGSLAAGTGIGPAGEYAFRPLPPAAYHLQVVDADGDLLALQGGSQVDVGPAGPTASRAYVLRVAAPPTHAKPTRLPRPQPGTGGGNVISPASGQITGVVTAAGTGDPLAYATVDVYNQAGNYVDSTYTASGTGAYSLTGLATGIYKVHFAPPYGTLYAPKWYNNQYDQANATDVLVTDGATTPNINASLDVGGQITGLVSAAAGGAPLQSVGVYAYTSRTSADYDYVAYAYSDSSGVYTISGLASGSYYLKFENADYLTLYYNNRTSLATADPVSVTLGATTTNINAALSMGGRITGHVTAASGGALLENVGVHAYTSRTAASYDYIAYAYTDASGVYTITGLASGTYYLKFEKTDYLTAYFNNRTSLATADPVSVTLGATTPDINAALSLGGKITGQVTAASGGAPVQNVAVYTYTSRVAASYDYIAYAYTDSSGVYTVGGLAAGNYYLKFSPPSSSDYVPEYYDNQPKLATADPVSVALGAVTNNINAALSTGGKISGHVTDEQGGAPLPAVQVSIYTPCGPQGLTFISSATTDASGNYTVAQLPTGSYLAEFDPNSFGVSKDYLGEYYDNKPSPVSANVISVTNGLTTGGIDAALTKGGKITGHVTAVNGGAALKDVYVDVYAFQGAYWSWVNYGKTDVSGAYSVTALPTANYKVEFDPQASGAAAAYVTEYYNDKATFSLADQVPVAAGGLVSGIDAALALGGQFTGTITAADGGAPLEYVSVTAYGSGGYYAYGSTNASGVYTTSGMPTGSYRLEFSTDYASATAQDYVSEYYNHKSTLASADPVPLSAPGQSVLNSVLTRGGAISGTVTSSLTGAPLEDVTVTILDGSADEVKRTYTDATGYYIARGLPTGVYRVHFSLSVNCSSLKYEIYYNQKPSLNTADPVSVTAPATTSTIHATLPVPSIITLSQCFLPLIRR